MRWRSRPTGASRAGGGRTISTRSIAATITTSRSTARCSWPARPALATADELAAMLPESAARPMADWFEAFVPMKQHVLIRFGMWEAILAQPLPEDTELYAMTTAVMRYARTVALANTWPDRRGRGRARRLSRGAGRRAGKPDAVQQYLPDILKIAEQMMLGELEYHRATTMRPSPSAPRRCARRHAALRRALGLDAAGAPRARRPAARPGRLDEAEAVYRADLGLDPTLARACQHPQNVWSLHGLHECLTRRGETVEARH
jgi:hypothetical protein